MRFFNKKTQVAPAPRDSEASNNPSVDGHSEKDKDDVAEATVTTTPSRTSSGIGNAAEKRIEGIEADADLALTQQASKDYPQGMKLGLITIALALSVFCLALDNTIISTAIPRITDK